MNRFTENTKPLGLCPKLCEPVYRQVAAGALRRLSKVSFRLEKEPWEHGYGDLADGLYCGTCFRRALARHATPKPLDALKARGDLGDVLDERPLPRLTVTSDMAVMASALRGCFQVVAEDHHDAVAPTFCPVPDGLHPVLMGRLQSRFPGGLYPHQVEALQAARDGHDVIQVTATGSGKTVGLLVPALHQLLTVKGSRVVVVTPRKVLPPQYLDFMTSLADESSEVMPGLYRLHFGPSAITVGIYDGDHSEPATRRRVERDADLVLTNEHMVSKHLCHKSFSKWKKSLSATAMVVIDEIDCARGHTASVQAQILGALRDIVSELAGRRPVMLTASASVDQPEAVHEVFTGCSSPTAIRDAGARREQWVQVIAPAEGVSVEETVRQVMIELTRTAQGSTPSTVVFTETQGACSALRKWVQHDLRREGFPAAAEAVREYHAGVVPSDRRGIEEDIETRTVRTVVSTSALGTGADLSALQVCVLAGLPDTTAEVRQYAGRVGRRSPGLVVIVLDDSRLGKVFGDCSSPTAVISSPTPHPVMTNSTDLVDVYRLRAVYHCLGRLPWSTVADLPAEVLKDLTDKNGGYTKVLGGLEPRAVMLPPEDSIQGSDSYLVLDGNQCVGKLGNWRGATLGFRGAEFLMGGHLYEVLKVTYLRGEHRLEVRRINERTGVSAYVDLEISALESRSRRVVRGMAVELAVGDMTAHIRTNNGSSARPRRWERAGVVLIHTSGTTSPQELAGTIRQSLWLLGISPYDLSITHDALGVRIVDNNRLGRMSWFVADHLDVLLGPDAVDVAAA